MSNPNLENLPPEMQARLAEIMQQAKAPQAPEPQFQQPQQAPAPPPAPRPPSLMDHVIALRQEVNQLSQQVAAAARVTEAVGNAVGEMYQMFQAQTAPSNYSSTFQEARPPQDVAEY